MATIGEIKMIAFKYAPSTIGQWRFCDGSLLKTADYPSLFALLGTTFGGNGSSTFGLPDLRGRAPLGADVLAPQGELGGEATHSLTLDEIPPHSHLMFAVAGAADQNTVGRKPSPSVALAEAVLNVQGMTIGLNQYIPPAAPINVTMASDAVGFTGKGSGHPNMQPYLAVNFVICVKSGRSSDATDPP